MSEQNQPNNYRTLNVKDALSYLDQVKVQFNDQPEVYNRFLDIMKDFKSQTIDTPGVIDRVSNLFTRHPKLITGFNTFLPPGYRIEPTNNPNDPVRVITPNSMEMMSQKQHVMQQQQQQQQHMHPQMPPQIQQQIQNPSQMKYHPHPMHTSQMQQNMQPIHPSAQQQQQQQPPMGNIQKQMPPTILPNNNIGHMNDGQIMNPHGQYHNHPVGPYSTNPSLMNSNMGHSNVPNMPNNQQQPDGKYSSMIQPPHMIPDEPSLQKPTNQPPMPHQLPPPQQPTPHPMPTTVSSQPQQQPFPKAQPSQVPPPQPQIQQPSKIQPPQPLPPQQITPQPLLPQQMPSLPPTPSPQQPMLQQPPQQQPQPQPPQQPPQPLQPPQQHIQPPSVNNSQVKGQNPSLPTKIQEQFNTRHKAPVEFNHAINYVNKIKDRFIDEPEIYKQFLEILQTYQKEQRQINEVYSQIRVLFKNATDLLEEFKQFLPDNSHTINADNTEKTSNQVESTANKRSQNQNTSVVSKKSSKKHQIQANNAANSLTSNAPPTKKIRTSTFCEDNSGTIEELEFFEKAKKVIGNKATYYEFLKILNLFSQNIIDAKTLVESVEPFLSRSPELFYWFKSFVKYEEEVEQEIVAPKYNDVDYRTCLRAGHSYRLLPLSLTHPKCSGRDALSYEVLNDKYVAHPIFLSEDGGFQAQKKNPYEEAMHRCEDERYDFDLYITCNLLVIAHFESLVNKMDKMTNEEKAKFKLPPDLGSKSPSIYQKIVNKVYDKEKGEEVILALQNNPAIAVPVVLRRLKQKNEEWKKTQKEWSKVWREVHNKNFYKSLDHRGLSFKATEKKNIAVKSLIHEIETLYAEQMEKRDSSNSYQFSLTFKDPAVFGDMKKLIRCYLRHSHSFSESDSIKINNFLKGFFSKFFHIKNIDDENEDDDEDEDDDYDKNDGTEESNTTLTTENESNDAKSDILPSKYNRDLRKELLIRSHENNKMDLDNMSNTNSSSISISDSIDSESLESSIRQSNESSFKSKKADTESLKIPTFRPIFLFFANNNFYCLFRLYHKLYDRLCTLKKLSEKMAKEPDQLEQLNPVAVELGLQSREIAKQNAEFCRKGRYTEELKLIRHFFEDTHENQEFEEKTRILFVSQAYQIFTVDKIVQAIAKQIQIITNDNVCSELMSLYNKDSEKDLHGPRREAIYKISVKTLLQDEYIYKFEYNNLESVLTIQLTGKDDYLTDSSISSEEKWSVYVDRYMQLGATEGIHAKPEEPFLKRNLPQVIPDEPPTNLIMHSGLELKICLNTYKIFFVNNTEDYFKRCHSAIPSKKIEALKNNRRKKFIAWYSKVNGISEEEGEKSLKLQKPQNKEQKSETTTTSTTTEEKPTTTTTSTTTKLTTTTSEPSTTTTQPKTEDSHVTEKETQKAKN